jgi:diguanylate cyclase (GGDEF)-like protein
LTADNTRMARSAGLLFGVGGIFAAVALALPHPAGSNEAGIVAVGAGALVAALLLFVIPATKIPSWVFPAMIFTGTGLISVGIYFWRPGPVANSVALLYTWVLLYSFYWFSTRLAIAHTVVVGAAFAVVLASQGGNRAAVSQWIVTVGTAAVSGVLIGWLVHQVHAMADTDPLTRLPNRRTWEQVLDRELARSRRQNSAVCVAIADLDEFKSVNDAGGHRAGDVLLVEIAQAWRTEVRTNEFLARYGGDEFALVLSCGLTEASDAVNRVLASFPSQSCTVGIACWDGSESRDQLVRRADVALYRGKFEGRSRLVLAGPTAT